MLSVFLLFLPFSALQLPISEGSSKSPYESGYDHGCDDADISDPDDRYINQPEKGPSFHTNEFVNGYNDGYDECSDGDSEEGGGRTTDDGDNGDSSQGGKTLEDYCKEYGDLVGKDDEECNDMVDGDDIKGRGFVFVLCNILKVAGISATSGLSAAIPIEC